MKTTSRLIALIINTDTLSKKNSSKILLEIRNNYTILAARKILIQEQENGVFLFKHQEWGNNWHPHPNADIQETNVRREANELIALLIESKKGSEGTKQGVETISQQLIAQECKNTISGKSSVFDQLDKIDMDVFFPEFKPLVTSQIKDPLSKLKQVGQNILKESPPDLVHEYNHSQRVWQFASKILKIENLSCSTSLIQCAAYWHDINKHDKWVDIASLALVAGCSTHEVQLFNKIIDRHGWRQTQHSDYEKVLFDADKLEYICVPRWQVILKCPSHERPLMKMYFEGLNQRLQELPDRLHYASSKTEFLRLLPIFTKWAQDNKMYVNKKLVLT